VDFLSRRHLRLDGVEEADELLMPVALHIASDDGAVALCACQKRSDDWPTHSRRYQHLR
jgi:hypothetical protein